MIRLVDQAPKGPGFEGPRLGIDLGTTHSVAAVFDGERARIVANTLGRTLLSSAVVVDADGALLVGDPALERIRRHGGHGAVRFKSEMGTERRFDLGGRSLGPVELSALVLKELKASVEADLGEPVRDAVITVPAWFAEHQRRATIAAGELADLRVRRVLNEPTAAALAHGLQTAHDGRSVVVLDLGGGTFDVTALELFEGVAEVKASAGDLQLGGEDFTDALLEAFAEEGASSEERAQLRAACERAKRRLSDETDVELHMPSGRKTTVDRASFERLNAERIARVKAKTQEALLQAGWVPADVDEVVLVGGATRMPSIHRLVHGLFGKRARVGVDVDHIIAEGAAIQAALLARDAAVDDFVVTDVTSHSLGIAVVKTVGPRELTDRFDPILPRSTTIPTTRKGVYSTLHAQQKEMNIEIYQGERRIASENHLLGRLTIQGLPPSDDPDHRVGVEIRFSHDANGLLEVEAQELGSERSVSTVIERGPTLSVEAKTEALEALAKLKAPPQEELPNRYALERARRLFEILPAGTAKETLDEVLTRFEVTLEHELRDQIPSARAELAEVVSAVAKSTGVEL
ncbi:MAG: Hsp70 family protein [Myxococcota bacterium]